jgi:hypothetical protein
MSTENQESLCLEKDRVIVRIWTSKFNKSTPGHGVGHVSIETSDPESYMSLWPNGRPDEKMIVSLFEKRPAHYMSSYQDDLDAEQREPELVYCLYRLDIYKILEKFENIQGKNEGWTLFGNNILIHGGGSHSCSSMAYALLKSGGIYDKISSGYSSQYASVVSPDNLVDAVKAAKKYEVKHYPQTVKFDNNFLTIVATEQNNKRNFSHS